MEIVERGMFGISWSGHKERMHRLFVVVVVFLTVQLCNSPEKNCNRLETIMVIPIRAVHLSYNFVSHIIFIFKEEKVKAAQHLQPKGTASCANCHQYPFFFDNYVKII